MLGLNNEQRGQFIMTMSVMLFAVASSFALSFFIRSWNDNSTTPPKPIDQEFPDFQPAPTSTGIIIYDNFIFEDIISSPNILKNSRIIRLEGKLDSGSLFVKASVRPDYCWDETRKHSIYFYVDNGDNGGQLDAVRENAVIVQGGFTNSESPYENTFNLNAVPVSQRVNGHRTIDVIAALSDNKPHYMGAFVATGKCGVLNELRINYTCSKETPECRIRFSE